MPKLGMEPLRRDAIIRATIREIGDVGSLDVTVGRIARRAGMSPALAHHYFGSKEQIFLAAMRHILAEFGRSAVRLLREAEGPMGRIGAIIDASFDAGQFDPPVISAWLVFYVQAQTSPEAARLLRIYARRTESNLRHELRQLTTPAEAAAIAQSTAALIDGFYIRRALADRPADPLAIREMTRAHVLCALAAGGQARA